jgi:hypothetical protein
MALHATNLVLQTPPRMLERIIDRKINVSVALVGIRLVPNIDLLFIRQSDADMDLEKTAGPVVLPWTFQQCLETRYALGFPSWLLDYRRAKESVLASN